MRFGEFSRRILKAAFLVFPARVARSQMLTLQKPIESHLTTHLSDHLNAEVRRHSPSSALVTRLGEYLGDSIQGVARHGLVGS